MWITSTKDSLIEYNMRKVFGIIVLSFLFNTNIYAVNTCVPGTDVYGNKVLDCSLSGGGFYREGEEGSGLYRNDYGVN